MSQRDLSIESYSEIIVSNYEEDHLKYNQLRVLSLLNDNQFLVEEFLCQSQYCLFDTYDYRTTTYFDKTTNILSKPNSNLAYLYTPNKE